MLAVLLAAAMSPAPPAPEEPVEIVVQAVEDKCRVQFADRILSKRELRARARTWAEGTPIRVIAPRGRGYKCLSRIGFRLRKWGVRVIHFVDAPERP